MTSASASRVTRSSRSLRRAALLFAGVLAGVTVLRAQEPPAATPPATVSPAPAAAPAGTNPAVPAPAVATDPKPAGKASEPPASTSTPSRFEPTEKVRADFDVSFPVDI
jgi:uncharacterized membrane protein